ncbi:fimbrial protein [Neisseriaceae bacterium CLB008]
MNFRSLALGLALSSLTTYGFAADGTIEINGMVTAATCKVNAGSTNNIKVSLPVVSAQSFKAVGDTAGKTPFSIKLTECSEDSKDVSVAFSAAQASLFNATGHIVNQAQDPAANVNIVLFDEQNGGQKLKLAQGAEGKAVKVVNKGAVFNYTAAYIAEDKTVGAGQVRALMTYDIAYK